MVILVVEDNRDLLASISGMIRAWGHVVEEAVNANQAMAAATDHPIDLVILDILLPDGYGYEIIPKIREACPEAMVIAMTGENSWELERKVREQGVFFYLIKPFEFRHLKDLIEHLDKRESNVERSLGESR